MSSLLKAFKEFYNEINGATLTGAIDVIVVEQEDGNFICSPFHVRFGKLGVLRSREKIVDIEVNGEPVDIHMKLGESGEAFFVQECDDDSDELPINLTTSPLPPADYVNKTENDRTQNDVEVKVRRNSLAHPAKADHVTFVNQTSDYKKRRHSEKVPEPSELNEKRLEYTTEQLRKALDIPENAFITESNESVLQKDNSSNHQIVRPKPKKSKELTVNDVEKTTSGIVEKTKIENGELHTKETESKSKKKRRKKASKKNSNGKIELPSKINENPIAERTEEVETDNKIASNNLNVSHDRNRDDESLSNEKSRICDIHFFSDTEIANSPCGSRPSTPIQSDSEFEISQRDNAMKNGSNLESSSTASWKWGELPTTPVKNDADISMNKEKRQTERNSTLSTMFSFMKETMKKRKNQPEGVYLSDLIDTENVDPELVAMYFPQKPETTAITADNEDHESENGPSFPLSPSSVFCKINACLEFDFEQDGKLFDKNVIALSLCGGLEQGGPTEEEFQQHLIDYAEVCRDPTIFSSPELVVRLCGKYYNWTAACPIVMTAIAYRKPLSTDAIEQLMNANKKLLNDKPDDESNAITKNEENGNENEKNRENRPNTAYSWWTWRRSTENRNISLDKSINKENSGIDKADISTSIDIHGEHASENCKTDDSISSELANLSTNSVNEKYRKTLRLTSDQIKSLNLKPGMNELEFSVTTAYQGTSRCKCYVFRWKFHDKVVISDIDGTITKSDVLGHILPMVGKDWAQLGVAELFTKIEQNGYKLLYLSARAIGQSRATRDYLRSIQQGNTKLPDGPLLLNPTSLISAFHREVIERKPEEFKIACLSDIKALFPQNPFYAGYGNRINDVWAYRAVGIPIIRIFTINPKGELKHELNRTFQSTYRSMTYIVDQLFPPVNDREESFEFSSVNYWREPVFEIDCDPLLETKGSKQITDTGLPNIPEIVKT